MIATLHHTAAPTRIGAAPAPATTPIDPPVHDQPASPYAESERMLSPRAMLLHHRNQDRFAHALQSFLATIPNPTGLDAYALLAPRLHEVLTQAGFDPSIYRPKDDSVHGYGTFGLLAQPDPAEPFCVQVFCFQPGQKTPIHDHPCECTSVVALGTVTERAYQAKQASTGTSTQLEKINRTRRDVGHSARLTPEAPNIHSLRYPKHDGPNTPYSVTVHAYRIDGATQYNAVKRIYAATRVLPKLTGPYAEAARQRIAQPIH